MPISTFRRHEAQKHTKEDTSEIITFTINDLLDGVSDAETEKNNLTVENLNSNRAVSQP